MCIFFNGLSTEEEKEKYVVCVCMFLKMSGGGMDLPLISYHQPPPSVRRPRPVSFLPVAGIKWLSVHWCTAIFHSSHTHTHTHTLHQLNVKTYTRLVTHKYIKVFFKLSLCTSCWKLYSLVYNVLKLIFRNPSTSWEISLNFLVIQLFFK